jgi:hypothetical protein
VHAAHTHPCTVYNKQKFKLESHLSHFRGFFDKNERLPADFNGIRKISIGFGRSVCKEVTAVAVSSLNVAA